MNEPIRGDALRGHLEAMVLSVLERGETHGFEIVNRLRAAGEGSLELREGSVYPALYRLEASGQVKARWESANSGRRGPRRRLYRLTRKGEAALNRARGEWRQFVSVVGGIVGGVA
jgi:DNA-binding PadR family transcriptional regulator